MHVHGQVFGRGLPSWFLRRAKLQDVPVPPRETPDGFGSRPKLAIQLGPLPNI